MWIYVDINTWCVVFHIDEHVMCGLSYWWTRACVSFVLALCCNALAFSRNEISKFSKLIFWILLVVYNIKWLISTTCQVVGYFFISISDKVLWLIKLIWVLGLKIIWLLVPSSQFEWVFNMTVTAWISRILKNLQNCSFSISYLQLDIHAHKNPNPIYKFWFWKLGKNLEKYLAYQSVIKNWFFYYQYQLFTKNKILICTIEKCLHFPFNKFNSFAMISKKDKNDFPNDKRKQFIFSILI